MRYTTTVSAKGQIIIPKEIRDKLGLLPSTLMNITLEGGKIIIVPLISNTKAFGSFKVPGKISKELIKKT